MMEQEKRMRREIANSNERRRMESINAGFQSLKTLLPRRDGEKISKAAILQQTSEFIAKLQREKLYLSQQIAQYKMILESNCVAVGKQSPLINSSNINNNNNSNSIVSNGNNGVVVGGDNNNNNSSNFAVNDSNYNNKQMTNNNRAVSNGSSSSSINGGNINANSNHLTASQENNGAEATTYVDDVPHKRRRKYEAISTDSSDEGVGMMSEPETLVSVKRENNTPHYLHHPSPLQAGAQQAEGAHQNSSAAAASKFTTRDAWSQTASPLLDDQTTLSAEALISLNRDKFWETDLLQRQLLEIRLALERERRLRMVLEEQIRTTEINRLQSLSRLSILEYPTTYHQPVIPTSLLSSAVVVSTTPHYVNAPAGGCSLVAPLRANVVESVSGDRSPKSGPGSVVLKADLASPPPESLLLSASAPPPPRKLSSSPAGGAPSAYIMPPSGVPFVGAGAQIGGPPTATANNPGAMLAADLQRRATLTPAAGAVGTVGGPFAPSNAFQSRQSLEAIVEAIRHLEGDQMFLDSASSLKNNISENSNINNNSSSSSSSVSSLLANNLCNFRH